MLFFFIDVVLFYNLKFNFHFPIFLQKILFGKEALHMGHYKTFDFLNQRIHAVAAAFGAVHHGVNDPGHRGRRGRHK